MHANVDSPTGRRLAAGIVLLGSALLGGCAVTTGPYHADRSSLSNGSMTSHFDVLRQQSMSGGSSLHMPRSRYEGPLYFMY
jgi:hypothetical protein